VFDPALQTVDHYSSKQAEHHLGFTLRYDMTEAVIQMRVPVMRIWRSDDTNTGDFTQLAALDMISVTGCQTIQSFERKTSGIYPILNFFDDLRMG